MNFKYLLLFVCRSVENRCSTTANSAACLLYTFSRIYPPPNSLSHHNSQLNLYPKIEPIFKIRKPPARKSNYTTLVYSFLNDNYAHYYLLREQNIWEIHFVPLLPRRRKAALALQYVLMQEHANVKSFSHVAKGRKEKGGWC